MSNIKFSQLPNLGAITANTVVPVVAASTNYTITAANLQSYVNSSAGNITGGNILTGGQVSATGSVSGTIFVGKPPLTAIKTETSNYTPTANDHGFYIQMNSTSPVTVTLVADVVENMPVGTTFVIGQINTGGVEFAAGAGATVHSPVSLVISGQWAKASVIKTAANTWQVEGNLAP